MATSKPEVVTSHATKFIGTRFWCVTVGSRGRRDQWNIDRQRFMLERHRVQQAASKPEVVITLATIGIWMRFLCLRLCFRGRRDRWNIDRQRFMLARHRIQHGRLQTGSSNNFCYKWHKNAILVAYNQNRIPMPFEAGVITTSGCSNSFYYFRLGGRQVEFNIVQA